MPGYFDHAWRKSLLNPDSERIGDLNSVKVLQIPPIGSGTPAIPQNGLRIQIDGEYIDPIDLTNTDVTMTIDLRPKRADDGSLEWDTNFDVDVDALFEFTTIWAATLLGILFGPAGALYFLGAVFLVELGVGIGISLLQRRKRSGKGRRDSCRRYSRPSDDLDSAVGSVLCNPAPGRNQAEPGRIQSQGLYDVRQGVCGARIGAA